jgi:hypothetical protein
VGHILSASEKGTHSLPCPQGGGTKPGALTVTIEPAVPDAIAPDGSEIYFLVGDARRASLVEVRLAAGQTSVLTIRTGCAFQFQAGPLTPLRFLCYTSPPWPGDQEAEAVTQGGIAASGDEEVGQP